MKFFFGSRKRTLNFVTTKQWFSCNDKVTFQVKSDNLNNKTPYVPFFFLINDFVVIEN